MNHYKKLFSVFALAVMTTGISLAAFTNGRESRFENDYRRSWKNDAYLYSAIRALRNNSRTFEGVLRDALNLSRYDGKRRENQINKLAKGFKNAAKSLNDKYKRYKSTKRSVGEARRVLRIGSQLDQMLSRMGKAIGSYSVESSWREIEQDLRIISREYKIKYDGQYSQYTKSQNKNLSNRGKEYSRRNVQNLRPNILRLQSRSRRFGYLLENDSRHDGRLKRLSSRFNDAIDALEDEYSEARDHGNSYNEARRVVKLGEQIDREISATKGNKRIRREWGYIERDLRIISREYKIKYDGQYPQYNRNKKRGHIEKYDRRDSRDQRSEDRDDDDNDDEDDDDDD